MIWRWKNGRAMVSNLQKHEKHRVIKEMGGA